MAEHNININTNQPNIRGDIQKDTITELANKISEAMSKYMGKVGLDKTEIRSMIRQVAADTANEVLARKVKTDKDVSINESELQKKLNRVLDKSMDDLFSKIEEKGAPVNQRLKEKVKTKVRETTSGEIVEDFSKAMKALDKFNDSVTSVTDKVGRAYKIFDKFKNKDIGAGDVQELVGILKDLSVEAKEAKKSIGETKDVLSEAYGKASRSAKAVTKKGKAVVDKPFEYVKSKAPTKGEYKEVADIISEAVKKNLRKSKEKNPELDKEIKRLEDSTKDAQSLLKSVYRVIEQAKRKKTPVTTTERPRLDSLYKLDSRKLQAPDYPKNKATQESMPSRIRNAVGVYRYEPGVVGRPGYTPTPRIPDGEAKTSEIIKNVDSYNKKLEKSLEELQNYISETIEKTLKESNKGWETVTKQGKKFRLSGMGAGESGLKGTSWKMSIANVPAIKGEINKLQKQIQPGAEGRGYDPKASVSKLIENLQQKIIESEVQNLEASVPDRSKRAKNYSTAISKWLKAAEEEDFNNLVTTLTDADIGGGFSKEEAKKIVNQISNKKQAKKGDPVDELAKDIEGLYGSQDNMSILRELYKKTHGRQMAQERMRESGLVKSVEVPAVRFSEAGTPFIDTAKGSKKSVTRFAKFTSGLESFIEEFNKLADVGGQELASLTSEYKKAVSNVGLRPAESQIGGLIGSRLEKLATQPKDRQGAVEYLKKGYKEAAAMRAAQLKRSGAIESIESFMNEFSKMVEEVFSSDKIPEGFTEKFAKKGVRPSDFIKSQDKIEFENIYDVYKKVLQGKDDQGRNLLEEFARNPYSSKARKLEQANRQVQGLLPLLPDEKSRRGYHQEHVMNVRAKTSELYPAAAGSPEKQKELIKDLNLRFKEMIDEVKTLPPEYRREGTKGLSRIRNISTLGLPESQASTMVSYKKGKVLTDEDEAQFEEGIQHLKPLGGIGLKMYTESLPSQAPFKEFQQAGRNITNVTNALMSPRGAEFPALRSVRENQLIQSGRFGTQGYGQNVVAELRHTPNTFEDQVEVAGKLADVMTETVKRKLFPSVAGRVEDTATEKALEGLTISPVESGQKLADISEKDINELNKVMQTVLGVETKYKGRADKALIEDVRKTIAKVREKDVEVQAADIAETFFSHYGRKLTTRYGSKGVSVQPSNVEFVEDLGKQVRPKSMGELFSELLGTQTGKEAFKASNIGGDIESLKEDFADAGNKFLVSFTRDARKGIVDPKTAKRSRDLFNKYASIMEKLGGEVTGKSVEDIRRLKQTYKERTGGELTKEVPIDLRISSKGVGKRGLQPEVLEMVMGNVLGIDPHAKDIESSVLQSDINFKKYKKLLGSATEKGEFQPGKLFAISQALGYKGAAEKPDMSADTYNKLKEKFMETMDEDQAAAAAKVEMLANYYSDVIESTSGKRRKGLVGPKFIEIIEEPHATEPWSMEQVKNLQKGMKLNIPAYSAYEDIFGKESAMMEELRQGVGAKFQEQLETLKAFLAGPLGGIDPKQKKQIANMRQELFKSLGETSKVGVKDIRTFDASTGSFDQPEELRRSLKGTIFDPEKLPSSAVMEIPAAEDNDIERRKTKPFYIPGPNVRDTYDEPLLAGERGFTKSGRFLNMIVGEAKRAKEIADKYDEFKKASDEEDVMSTVEEAGLLDRTSFKGKFKDYLFNRRSEVSKDKRGQVEFAKQLKQALDNIAEDIYKPTSPMGRHKARAQQQLGDVLASDIESVGSKKLNDAINNAMDVLIGPKAPGENAPESVKKYVESIQGKDYLEQIRKSGDFRQKLPAVTEPFGGMKKVGKGLFESAYKDQLEKLKDRQLKYQEALSEDVLGKTGSLAEVFFTRRQPAQMAKAVTSVVDKRKELSEFSNQLDELYNTASELMGGTEVSDLDIDSVRENLEEVRKKHVESIQELKKQGFTPLKQEEIGVPENLAKKIPVSYKKRFGVAKGEAKRLEQPEDIEGSLYDLLNYKEQINKAINKASKAGETTKVMELQDYMKGELAPYVESVRYPFTGTSSIKPYKPKILEPKKGKHGQDLFKDVMAVPGVPDFDYEKFDKIVGAMDTMLDKATQKREEAFEAGDEEKAQRLTQFIEKLSQAISDVIPRYRALEQKLDFDGDQIEIHSAKTAEARKEIEKHLNELNKFDSKGIMNAVRRVKEYEEAAGGGKTGENILADMAKSFYKKFNPEEGFEFMQKPFLTEKLEYLSGPEKLEIISKKKGGSPEGIIQDILGENLTGELRDRIGESIDKALSDLSGKQAEPKEYFDKLSEVGGDKLKNIVESGLTDKLYSAKYEDAIEAQIYKTHTGPEVEAITRVKRIADLQNLGKGMGGPVTQKLDPSKIYDEYMNEVMRFAQQKGMDVKHAGAGTVTADIVEALSKEGGVSSLYKQIGMEGAEGDELFSELKDLHENSKKALETTLGQFSTEQLREQAKKMDISDYEKLGREGLKSKITEEFSFKGFMDKLSNAIVKAAEKVEAETKQSMRTQTGNINLRRVHDELLPTYGLRTGAATPEDIYRRQHPKSETTSRRGRITAVYDEVFKQLQSHRDIKEKTPYHSLMESGYENIAKHLEKISNLYTELKPPEGARQKDLANRLLGKQGMSEHVRQLLYKKPGSSDYLESLKPDPKLRGTLEEYSTVAGLPPMSDAKKRELTQQYRPAIKKEGLKHYARDTEELDKFIDEKLEQIYALHRLDKIYEAIKVKKEETSAVATGMFPRVGGVASTRVGDLGKIDTGVAPSRPKEKMSVEDMGLDVEKLPGSEKTVEDIKKAFIDKTEDRKETIQKQIREKARQSAEDGVGRVDKFFDSLNEEERKFLEDKEAAAGRRRPDLSDMRFGPIEGIQPHKTGPGRYEDAGGKEPPRGGGSSRQPDFKGKDVVPVYVTGVADEVATMFSKVKADVGARRQAMNIDEMTTPGGGRNYEREFGSAKSFAPIDHPDPNVVAFDALKKLRTEAISFQEGLSRTVEPTKQTHKEVAEAIQKVQEGEISGKEFGDLMTELKKAKEIEGREITNYWRMYRKAKADFFLNEAKQAQEAVEYYSKQPGEEFKASAAQDRFVSNVKRLQEFIKSGAGKSSDIFTEGSRYIDPNLARAAGVWESPAEIAKKSTAPLGDDEQLKNIYEQLTKDVLGEGEMIAPTDKARFAFRSLGDIKPEIAAALSAGEDLEDLGVDINEAWNLDNVVGNISRLREALERFLKFNISEDFQSEQRKNIQMTIKQLKKLEDQYTSFGKKAARFSDETIVEPVPRQESRSVQEMFNRLNVQRLQEYFETRPDRGGPRKGTEYRYNEKIMDRLGTVQKSIRHTFEKSSERGFTHRTKNLLEEGDTFKAAIGRAARWGAASRIVYGGFAKIGDMLDTIKDIESYMARLKMVMNKTETNFDQMRESAIGMAKEYGVSIDEILQGMKVFAQQGLKQAEVLERTKAATLAANVTTLNAAEATEALTAATKIYGSEAQDTMRYLDAWSEVESKHAITAGDMANAMKKSAAAAKNAGVTFDQLNGIIAGIGTVTRQSGREVSTALRFIFRRLTSEKGPRALANIGIPTLTDTGELRKGFNVLDDLADKWDELNSAQKMNVAQSIGGTRQYNALLVLMDNWAEALETVQHSINSKGSAERRNLELMKTYEKQLQQTAEAGNELKVQFGKVFLPIAKTGFKGLKGVLEMIANVPGYIKKIVGGMSAFILLLVKGGGLITSLFENIKEGKGIMGDFLSTAKEEFGKGIYEVLGKDLLGAVTKDTKERLKVIGGKRTEEGKPVDVGKSIYDFETFMGKAGHALSKGGRAFNKKVGDLIGFPAKLFLGAGAAVNNVGDVLSGNVNPMDTFDLLSDPKQFSDVRATAEKQGGSYESIMDTLKSEGLKSGVSATVGAGLGTAGKVVGMPLKGLGAVLGTAGGGLGAVSKLFDKMGGEGSGFIKSMAPLLITLKAMQPALKALYDYWNRINMTAADYQKHVHDSISALSKQAKVLKNVEFRYKNVVEDAAELFKAQRKRTMFGGVQEDTFSNTGMSLLYNQLSGAQNPPARTELRRGPTDFWQALEYRNNREEVTGEPYDWTTRDYPELAGKFGKMVSTEVGKSLGKIADNTVSPVGNFFKDVYGGISAVDREIEGAKNTAVQGIRGVFTSVNDYLKSTYPVNRGNLAAGEALPEPMPVGMSRRRRFEEQVAQNVETAGGPRGKEFSPEVFGAFEKSIQIINEYNNVANELSKVNADVVHSYDELGNAILNASGSMQMFFENQKKFMAENRADKQMEVLSKYADSLSDLGGDEKFKDRLKSVLESDALGIGELFSDKINLGSRYKLDKAVERMNEVMQYRRKSLGGGGAFEDIIEERRQDLTDARRAFNEELGSFRKQLRNQEMFGDLEPGSIIERFQEERLRGGFKAMAQEYNKAIENALLSNEPYISGLGEIQAHYTTTPRQVMITEAMKAAYPEETGFLGYNMPSTLGRLQEEGIKPTTGKQAVHPGYRAIMTPEATEQLGIPSFMPMARIDKVKQDADDASTVVLSYFREVGDKIKRETEEMSKETAENLMSAIIPSDRLETPMEERKRLLYERISGAGAGISALSPKLYKEKIDLGARRYSDIESSTLLQSRRLFMPNLGGIGRQGPVGYYGTEAAAERETFMSEKDRKYLSEWPKDFKKYMQEPAEELERLRSAFDKQKLKGLSDVARASISEGVAEDFRNALDLHQNNAAVFQLRKSFVDLTKTLEQSARAAEEATEAYKVRLEVDKESAGLLRGMPTDLASNMNVGKRSISDLSTMENLMMRSTRARDLARNYGETQIRLDQFKEMADSVVKFRAGIDHFVEMAKQIGLDIKPEEMEKFLKAGVDKSTSMQLKLQSQSLEEQKRTAQNTSEIAKLIREDRGELKEYRTTIDKAMGKGEDFRERVQERVAARTKARREGIPWGDAATGPKAELLPMQEAFKGMYERISEAEKAGQRGRAINIRQFMLDQMRRVIGKFGAKDAYGLLEQALPRGLEKKGDWVKMFYEAAGVTPREAAFATKGKEISADRNWFSKWLYKDTKEIMSDQQRERLTGEQEAVSPMPSPWVTKTNELATTAALTSLIERMSKSRKYKEYENLLTQVTEGGKDWKDVTSWRSRTIGGEFSGVENQEEFITELRARMANQQKQISVLDSITAMGAITGGTQIGGHLLNRFMGTNISTEGITAAGHAAAGTYVAAKSLGGEAFGKDAKEALEAFREAADSGDAEKINKAAKELNNYFNITQDWIETATKQYKAKTQKDKSELEKEINNTMEERLKIVSGATGMKGATVVENLMNKVRERSGFSVSPKAVGGGLVAGALINSFIKDAQEQAQLSRAAEIDKKKTKEYLKFTEMPGALDIIDEMMRMNPDELNKLVNKGAGKAGVPTKEIQQALNLEDESDRMKEMSGEMLKHIIENVQKIREGLRGTQDDVYGLQRRFETLSSTIEDGFIKAATSINETKSSLNNLLSGVKGFTGEVSIGRDVSELSTQQRLWKDFKPARGMMATQKFGERMYEQVTSQLNEKRAELIRQSYALGMPAIGGTEDTMPQKSATEAAFTISSLRDEIDSLEKEAAALLEGLEKNGKKLKILDKIASGFYELTNSLKDVSNTLRAETMPAFEEYKRSMRNLYGGSSPTATQSLGVDDIQKMVELGMSRREAISRNFTMDQYDLKAMRLRHQLATGQATGKEAFEVQRDLQYVGTERRLALREQSESRAIDRLKQRQAPFEQYYRRLTEVLNTGDLGPQARKVVQEQREQIVNMLQASTEKIRGGTAFAGIQPEKFGVGERHQKLLTAVLGKETDKTLQEYMKEMKFSPLLDPLNSIKNTNEKIRKIVAAMKDQIAGGPVEKVDKEEAVKDSPVFRREKEKEAKSIIDKIKSLPEDKREKAYKELGKQVAREIARDPIKGLDTTIKDKEQKKFESDPTTLFGRQLREAYDMATPSRSVMDKTRVTTENTPANLFKKQLGQFFGIIGDVIGPAEAAAAEPKDYATTPNKTQKTGVPSGVYGTSPGLFKSDETKTRDILDATGNNVLDQRLSNDIKLTLKHIRQQEAVNEILRELYRLLDLDFSSDNKELLDKARKKLKEKGTDVTPRALLEEAYGDKIRKAVKSFSEDKANPVNILYDILGKGLGSEGKSGSDWMKQFRDTYGAVEIGKARTQPTIKPFDIPTGSISYHNAPFDKLESIRKEGIVRRGEMVPGRTMASLTGEGLDRFKEPRYDYGTGQWVGGGSRRGATGPISDNDRLGMDYNALLAANRNPETGVVTGGFNKRDKILSAMERGMSYDEFIRQMTTKNKNEDTTALRNPATVIGESDKVKRIKGDVAPDPEKTLNVYQKSINDMLKANKYFAEKSNVIPTDQTGVPSEDKGLAQRTKFSEYTGKYRGLGDAEGKSNMELFVDPIRTSLDSFLSTMIHEGIHTGIQNDLPASANMKEREYDVSDEKMEQLRKAGPQIEKLDKFLMKNKDKLPSVAGGFTREQSMLPGGGLNFREINAIKKYTGGYFGRKTFGSSSEFNRDTDFFRRYGYKGEDANRAMAHNYMIERQASTVGTLSNVVSSKTDTGEYKMGARDLVQGDIFSSLEAAKNWVNQIRTLKSNLEKVSSPEHIQALLKADTTRGVSGGVADKQPLTELRRSSVGERAAQYVGEEERVFPDRYRAMDAKVRYNRAVGSDLATGALQEDPRPTWSYSEWGPNEGKGLQMHTAPKDDPLAVRLGRHTQIDAETKGRDPFDVFNMSSKAAENYMKAPEKDQRSFEELWRKLDEVFENGANKMSEKIENVEFKNGKVEINTENLKDVVLPAELKDNKVQIDDDSIKKFGESVKEASKEGDRLGADKIDRIDKMLTDYFEDLTKVQEEGNKLSEEIRYLSRRQADLEEKGITEPEGAAAELENYILKSTNVRNLIDSRVDEVKKKMDERDEEFEHTKKEIVELREKTEVASSKADEARNRVSSTEYGLRNVLNDVNYIRDIMSYDNSDPTK